MKIDKSNMRQVIIDSPKQLAEGLKLAENIKSEGNFKNIVVCGMGGSTLPADILSSLGIQMQIYRDYDLPAIANKYSLVICISYSGNTEETVSALEKAINKKLKIIGVASGGKIEELCQKNDIPFVKIPNGIQPRSATGYIFSVLVKILENSGVDKNISGEIPALSEELGKINQSLEKRGKKLAEKINGKIPIIYSSNNFKSVAKIWKVKFNENSKVPSFYNVFPELNHNEMVGYENNAEKLFLIIIRDKQDHPKILKRMDLMTDLLLKKRVEVKILNLLKGSVIFKIFSSLLLGDWTSYHLALLHGIDPTPVKIVEEFKKLMESQSTIF